MKIQSYQVARSLAITRAEQQLRHRSCPRPQMALLVTLTGLFGLLASFALLHALRYPLALACAYAFFLFLVWLWLRAEARDYTDLPDLSGLAGGSDAPPAGDVAAEPIKAVGQVAESAARPEVP